MASEGGAGHNRPLMRSLIQLFAAAALLGALLGLAGAPGDGAEGQGGAAWVLVMLHSGERLSGELVSEGEERVVVRVAGVEVEIPRDEIETLVRQRPLLERYREMRGLIDDGDVGRLLTLVEWLRVNAMYDEAMAEVQHILRVSPNEPEALRQRDLIEHQIELAEKAGDPSIRRERGEDGEPATRRGRGPSRDIPLLTAEQINLIKVYEVDLRDPPELLIDRATVERLLERYASHPLVPSTREGREAFHRLGRREVLDIMFRVQARDLYGEVRVLDHPNSMRLFRDTVHRTWLVNRCGSIECHGGGTVWPYIHPRRPASDETVYTNFLTLERARLESGEPLIDHMRPAESLLLQMGLPRDETARPHPDVRGWRPAFRSRSDERYVQAVEWIGSLYRPRPEHPVDYEPPVARPESGGER